MAAESTVAIVLRTVEFSETSLIVTLLTRDFGQVAAIAKGARRPKSSFEGSLDLLAVCRVVLIRKASDSLDLLTEAKLNRRFRGADKSLPRLHCGYYLAEMLRLLTETHDPQPMLYDLTLDALSQIDGTGNAALALLGFDAIALRLLGHSPTTRTCADCGVATPVDRPVPFSPAAGGVVCGSCRISQPSVFIVRPETLQCLELLLDNKTRLPLATASAERIGAHYRDVRVLLSRYIEVILGKTPRMQSFLPARMEPSE